MEQNNNVNEIDVRKIVRIILEHWWWFAIGVMAFMLLGGLYFLRKSPTWTTDAAIMLRQNEGGGFDQIEALSMLGLSGNSAAEDEVVVLKSRGLIYQAVDALNLWESTYVKDGLRWKGEFHNNAVTVDYIELNKRSKITPFTITIKPTNMSSFEYMFRYYWIHVLTYPKIMVRTLFGTGYDTKRTGWF